MRNKVAKGLKRAAKVTVLNSKEAKNFDDKTLEESIKRVYKGMKKSYNKFRRIKK